jgi:flagellar biosynthesis protein FlhG
MRTGAADARRRPRARPRLLVVAGGKGGLGTTTISVNLAVASALAGNRTLLIDGHLGRSDAAALCGSREGYTIADVLAGRRTMGEALRPGPAGIQLLPGAWATAHVTDCAPAAQQRLLDELTEVHPRADVVVIDAGSGVSRVMRRFCAAADEVLLIASPDSLAIMDTYAALKTLRSAAPDIAPALAINLAGNARQAEEAEARLTRACRRFLGWEPRSLGHLAGAETVAAAGRAQCPFVLAAPRSPEARQINQWASALSCRAGQSNERRKLVQVASLL